MCESIMDEREGVFQKKKKQEEYSIITWTYKEPFLIYIKQIQSTYAQQ